MNHPFNRFAAVLAGLFLLCAAGHADQSKTADPSKTDDKAQVSIPFANHGGINNWQVESDNSLLIQGQGRQWYRATLMGNCLNLTFADRVGFVTNPGGSFDRFSQILVRGQRCSLISLVPAQGPVKKAKKPKAASPAPVIDHPPVENSG